MRSLILAIAMAAMPMPRSTGAALPFADVAKTSLVFREQSDPSAAYPHRVLVYLCLENLSDYPLRWVSNYIMDIEAELLDPKGNPVRDPGNWKRLSSTWSSYGVPPHSRLEWLISHSGGIALEGDRKNNFALVIGGKGWLISKESLSRHSLKLRIKGLPQSDRADLGSRIEPSTLFEIPSTPIVIK